MNHEHPQQQQPRVMVMVMVMEMIDEQIANLLLLIKRTALVYRVLASNLSSFLRDILVVLLGLRCSVLIEYALPEISDFVSLINTWKRTNLDSLSKNIVLFKVFEDVFIINLDLMKKRCKEETGVGSTAWKRHIFVDINVNLKQAELLDGEKLYKLTTPLVLLAEELLHKLELLEPDECVIDLIVDKETLWIPMLFGWILDYPVIYCNSFSLSKTDPKKIKVEDEKKKKRQKGKEKLIASGEKSLGSENDNCLSFVPLHLYKWKAQTNTTKSITTTTSPLITINTPQAHNHLPQKEKDKDTTITTTTTSTLEKFGLGLYTWVISSFSVPAEIDAQINNNNIILENWSENIHALDPITSCLWEIHTLEREVVTLPHVLL